VCGECRAAFGPMLRHNPEGERMTEEQVRQRNEDITREFRIARLRGHI
jgi:hypothetical protein